MITKIVTAALVTFSMATPALAADSVTRDGDTYIMRFEKVNPSRDADRARVVGGVKDTAKNACRTEGAPLERRACEREFTARALATIENPSQRVAMQDAFYGRAGGSANIVTIIPE